MNAADPTTQPLAADSMTPNVAADPTTSHLAADSMASHRTTDPTTSQAAADFSTSGLAADSTTAHFADRVRLERCLGDIGPLVVAVSGGVDSLTLAVAAGRVLGDVQMVHATSPAVPPEATLRVREWGAREGWRLEVVDAGEFADPNYLANPVNRCFFCKTNLYGSIRRLTDRQIVSGANLDDLAEYRPGLDAAREHGVRHPYIEARIDKAGVRRLSAALGLGDVARLPSSPCLSSRVETGIVIEPRALRSVHAIEQLVAARLAPSTVRCRIRATGIVVELDAATLAALSDADSATLADAIRDLAAERDGTSERSVRFAPYRVGSAFVGAPA